MSEQVIAVSVFVAEIGIGFAVLQEAGPGADPMNFGNVSPQQMRDAMQDPDFRQNMMNQMIAQDPELQDKINQQRLEHEQRMQEMMSSDLNDPQIQQKILE